MRIRLTAPIDGKASPRKPSAEIRERSSSGNFEVQWRSTASASSSGRHAGAVIGDRDQRLAAFLEGDVDARGAGVDRVLDQFLDRRCRALDDLARGDAVNQDRGKQADRHGRNSTPSDAPRRGAEHGPRRTRRDTGLTESAFVCGVRIGSGEESGECRRATPISLTPMRKASTTCARARELAPELAAAADEIERRRELPEPVVAALVERGLFRLLLPRSLGGAELLPADFVPVIEEIAKADASDGVVPQPGFGLLDDRSLSRARSGLRDLRRAARHPCLGPGAWHRPGRRGRLPRHGELELCQRQPQRHLARLPCPGRRGRRDTAPQPRWQPGHPHDAVPKIECPDDRHLACDRPQGDRQRPLFGRGSLCAAAAFGDARRRYPPRAGAALSL